MNKRFQINRARIIMMTLTTIIMTLAMQSCFTGIEHTGHINLTNKDREISRRISSEEAFMSDIKGISADQWMPGRRFLITGERASLVFEDLPDNYAGIQLLFDSIGVVKTPGGTNKIFLYFSDAAGRSYRYATTQNSATKLISTELPMLVDMTLVDALNTKLRGKRLWIKTPAWLDTAGNSVKGSKYVPVIVSRVEGGSENLPYFVIFTNNNGPEYGIRMSQTDGVLATRPFHTLFSLEDPRNNYSDISDEVWDLICKAHVEKGMTKEECRLSLGTPDDVQSMADYSKLIDIWTYSSGIYLRFEDGVLVYYRK